MNEFVEQCRQEWKRLGVPDPVANEMAADLEADLKEAEAEGASAEAVLGSNVFDPQAFAAAWATARGVTGQLPALPEKRSALPRRLPLIAGLALIGFVAAALVLHLAHTSVVRKQGTFVPTSPPPTLFPGPGTSVQIHESVGGVGQLPIGLILLLIGLVGVAFVLWSFARGPGRWSGRRT